MFYVIGTPIALDTCQRGVAIRTYALVDISASRKNITDLHVDLVRIHHGLALSNNYLDGYLRRQFIQYACEVLGLCNNLPVASTLKQAALAGRPHVFTVQCGGCARCRRPCALC